MSLDAAEERPTKRVRLESEAENGSNDSVWAAATEQQLQQEEQFGISRFFTTRSLGFSCVFKQRYTDFLVNEIRLSGDVVHLERKPELKPVAPDTIADTTSGIETANSDLVLDQTNQSEDNGDASRPIVPQGGEISADDTARLEAIFGATTTNDLKSLYAHIQSHPGRKPKFFSQYTSESIQDKQQRTDAHITVRAVFNGRIETTTGDDNRILIKAASSKGGARQPRGSGEPRTKGKVGWDELGGEHLHFTLYKENKDTMEVLYFMASQLKTHVKTFQFAGTKDRRGCTAQRVSGYRMIKERLERLNPSLRQAKLSGYEHEKKGLDLGDLAGNEFTIVLRDCKPLQLESGAVEQSDLEQTIQEAVWAIQQRGFVNHYGLQRFGSFAVSTDAIGRMMLQGDFKAAVEGILTYSQAALADEGEDGASSKVSSDDRGRAKALDTWYKTHKTGQTIEHLPRKFQAENAIIRHLGMTDKRSGRQNQLEDYQGALQQIPRNLRLMYVHAYQSRVWNMVASKRHQISGNQVIEGDLVIVKPKSDGHNGKDEVDEDGEVIIRPTGEDSATSFEDKLERARPLTEEEANSGKYTALDVVLPLPGWDVAYPKNYSGNLYKEIMAKDNLDPDDMRRKWRDISLSGSYRKMLGYAKDVSHEVRRYNDDEEQLALTDRDRVEGRTELPAVDAGSKLAVILQMKLPSSHYATMALRELTKGGALAFKPDYSGR